MLHLHKEILVNSFEVMFSNRKMIIVITRKRTVFSACDEVKTEVCHVPVCCSIRGTIRQTLIYKFIRVINSVSFPNNFTYLCVFRSVKLYTIVTTFSSGLFSS